MITHLYIKTHNVTGLKYFGKTTQNPYLYKGSGTRWISHTKKYGNDVSTMVVASFDDSQLDDMEDFALSFSEIFDITDSKMWANLKPENGLDGGDNSHFRTYRSPTSKTRSLMSSSARKRPAVTSYTRHLISVANVGKRKPPRSDQHRSNLSKAMSGENHPNFGKHRSDETKRRISEAQLGENGYWFGKSHSVESNQKRSDSLKARYGGEGCSEAVKLKIGEKARGTTHITNGVVNKRVNLDTQPIPSGFVVGFTKPTTNVGTGGRKWITSGTNNMLVFMGTDFRMPDGYVPGKTNGLKHAK